MHKIRTVWINIQVTVTCEACGTRYYYDHSIVERSNSIRNIFLTIFADLEQLVQRRLLRGDYGVCPCPGCGYIQSWMLYSWKRIFWPVPRLAKDPNRDWYKRHGFHIFPPKSPKISEQSYDRETVPVWLPPPQSPKVSGQGYRKPFILSLGNQQMCEEEKKAHWRRKSRVRKILGWCAISLGCFFQLGFVIACLKGAYKDMSASEFIPAVLMSEILFLVTPVCIGLLLIRNAQRLVKANS